MGQIDPDPNFIRDLKNLSPALSCHFSNKHCRFLITHERAVGEPIVLLQIKNEDGSFKHPDLRDIDFIASGDTHKSTPKERAQRTAKYMEDYRADHHRNTVGDFRDRTKDDKLQLMRDFGQIHGSGKKIQPFRKIEVKPKGKVF